MDRPTLRSDRPTVRSPQPTAEPRLALLPLDFDEDYEDDSIYGASYRARVGAVLTERIALEPDRAVAPEPPAAKVARS
jgi:hypothetical protein